MNLKRSSGILLHPTSLPDTPGIGTIGKTAFRFIDWLHAAGQTLWQVLPLGPTGYGDSPYASFSTFAGNPLLIDLDLLIQEKLLTVSDCQPPDYISREGPVDYGAVTWWKLPLLKIAAKRFFQNGSSPEFIAFAREQSSWLDNFALFMSIKEHFDEQARIQKLNGKLWNNFWPKDLALRNPQAIQKWVLEHDSEINEFKAIQFFFFKQWNDLRKYAHSKGISIIGDIPIFVAADSADVWANQDLFQLDTNGSPKFVAGVPPDYFSATGQLWGNPLYDWHTMKKDGYAWWINRIKAMLSLVDFVRIDHFRGFEAFWSIPFGETTAINGKWEKGPDHDFFTAVKKTIGDAPILAEDLGLITEEVKQLRDDFGFPGMKVLQFAFDVNEAGKEGFTNAFLPHMYSNNCVVYTGTHDNDTMQGWIDHSSIEEQNIIRDYLGGMVEKNQFSSELIRIALMSPAVFAIFPFQDILGLGSEARMNTPSTLGSNWTWRMDISALDESKTLWLKKYVRFYARNQNIVLA